MLAREKEMEWLRQLEARVGPVVCNLLTAVAHPHALNKRVQRAFAVQTAQNMVYFTLDVITKTKWDSFFVVATVLPSIRSYAIDNGLGDLYPLTQPLTVTGNVKFSLGPATLMNAVGCSTVNLPRLTPEDQDRFDAIHNEIELIKNSVQNQNFKINGAVTEAADATKAAKSMDKKIMDVSYYAAGVKQLVDTVIEKQKHDRRFAETMAAESHRHIPVKYIETLLLLARDLPKPKPTAPKTPAPTRPSPRPAAPAPNNANNTNNNNNQ